MSTHQVSSAAGRVSRVGLRRALAIGVVVAVGLVGAGSGANAELDPDDTVQLFAAETLAAAIRHTPGTSWSVYIGDDTARTWLAYRDDEALLPASTMKTVTAATALRVLTPDGRRTTRLEVDGELRDGVLSGDVLLVGDWDPTLATADFAEWIYPDRPATLIDDLVTAVWEAGIRYVDGAVVGVERPTVRDRIAGGWPDRYFSSFDARNMAALSIDAGLWTQVGWEDDDLQRRTGTRVVAIPPDVGNEERPLWVAIRHAHDPALHAAMTLSASLVDRGVEVRDRPRRDRVGQRNGDQIATLESPRIAELVTYFMRTSDNHMADAVFRAAGLAHTGSDSWQAGQAAAEHTLDVLDVARDGVVIADGSGLSRDNRISARTLVNVDRAQWSGPHSELWSVTTARAGETGTLRRRFIGTAAEGTFTGKTGSLHDVIALHGAIDGSQRRMHLAFIVNDIEGPARTVARAAMDQLVEMFAAVAHGCNVALSDDEAQGSPSAGAAAAAGFPSVAINCD